MPSFVIMKQNPQIVYRDNGYIIRFVRQGGTILVWVQDLSSRKMKHTSCRPVVIFASKAEAEREARAVVIPYLLKNKSVDASEIVGWASEK